MQYYSLSSYLKDTFGTKVYKLSLQSGCSCPNRDGTLGTGGCTFCSQGGSGDFAAPLLPIDQQIRLAKERVNRKFPGSIPESERKYIAYFQSYTNTYGDPARLLKLFKEALSYPEIAAISIGTRPDCLPEEIISMLSNLNQIKPVYVELGLQTIHERTARRIHRGYPLETFNDAYRRLTDHGIRVVVHVILGLPGETQEDMLATVRYLAKLKPVLHGIKLQLLHILRGTKLAEEFESCPFPVMTLEEYCDIIVRCLKLLPPETVVHRITGDGPKSLLIAPLWSGDKKRVLNTLQKAIREA
ncbi:TIGR01212 family radical SAM protein [Oribacterium sp. HCP28S3_H8]|uniref:TIGR01212 family radical SAM protein n=1 Tax=Oribacterium sp. HCP28S3_H8 TaxID=3438945 RepID=UPI003F8CED67